MVESESIIQDEKTKVGFFDIKYRKFFYKFGEIIAEIFVVIFSFFAGLCFTFYKSFEKFINKKDKKVK